MAASSGARLLYSPRRWLGDFTKLLLKVLWPFLHLVRPRRMAGQTQYGSRARRAPPPADAGKIERWHQTLKNRILLENGPRNFLASVCIVAVLVCWV
jgi:hypothetical protein